MDRHALRGMSCGHDRDARRRQDYGGQAISPLHLPCNPKRQVNIEIKTSPEKLELFSDIF